MVQCGIATSGQVMRSIVMFSFYGNAEWSGVQYRTVKFSLVLKNWTILVVHIA